MPSGYETDCVYRLERRVQDYNLTWSLQRIHLDGPLRKRYDNGRVDEWLQSYGDAGPTEETHFLGGYRDEQLEGLLTWRLVVWNTTVWLLDIRTREVTRRTGVGSALIHRLKEIASAEDARGISVETQINNYPAISFYCKHGFEIVGFNDHLYTNRDRDDQDIALFLFWKCPESVH